jgi:LPXTG-site transpeptidase (sortase) family protein
VAFDRIQFDPNAVPLRSDLRILATIRTPGESDISIYLDRDGEKQSIRRADYISETNEPGLFKRDEVSVVSNWPRFGGPHVVVLPEGQRLLLGELPQGTTVDVAVWRTFIMAQTFSNRILVAATPNGIAAFQPRPGTAASPKSEPIYKDSKQQKDVQDILNSISEETVKPIVPAVAAVSVSPPYIEVSAEPEKVSPEAEEIPEIPTYFKETQEPVEAESLPEPEPEPEPELITTIAPVVIEPEQVRPRKSAKVMLVLSDVLITFAIFAIMFAGYQTVWSMFVSQQNIAEAKAEVELKWTEDPASEPELHKGFALIYIPRLQDKVWELPVTRGVDPDDLISGLGHYPDNALPGEKGNFALAGHRATYGEPLANIDQLKQNDEVIIQTSGNWYVYKLILDEIVEPDAMWVLDENPGGIVNKTGVEEMITITTCHPRWGSTHRWIWWGVLTEVRPYDQVPESIAAMQESQVE